MGAIARLAGGGPRPQGWVLAASHLPVADTLTDGRGLTLWRPIDSDAAGNTVGGSRNVWTGISASGVLDANCMDWSVAGASGAVGTPFADGVLGVSLGEPSACNVLQRLYCFGVDFQTPVLRDVPSGKLAFLTTDLFTPSTSRSPDGFCASQVAGAGVPSNRTFLALVATLSASAGSRFTSGPYTRIDGVALTLGASLKLPFLAGLDAVSAAVQTTAVEVWTGAPDLTSPGTDASTCHGWQPRGNGTDTGTFGEAGFVDGRAMQKPGTANDGCTRPRHLYCLEQ